MVQNKEIEDKLLTNGEIKVENSEKEENGDLELKLNGHISEDEESDEDDYLDHLLMLPPLDRDPTNRNKALISKTLLDFCAAIENRKEYQKIKQELLQNCVPIECKQEEKTTQVEPLVVEELILNGKAESPPPAVETEPIEVNEEEVAEIRRQSIRLKKATFGELNCARC